MIFFSVYFGMLFVKNGVGVKFCIHYDIYLLHMKQIGKNNEEFSWIFEMLWRPLKMNHAIFSNPQYLYASFLFL